MQLIKANKLKIMITDYILKGTSSVIKIPFPLNQVPRLQSFIDENNLTLTYVPTTHEYYPENTVILTIKV